MSSYPTKSFRRTALAPGILAAIVLLAGLALLESSAFFWIKTVTAILAAIIAVYAYQSKQWWWLPFLAAIVVLWNPIWPIDLHQDKIWLVLQYVAIILFIVCGIRIKVPNPDDRNRPGNRNSTDKKSRPSSNRR
ncbi:MAG: hypothetical protein QOK08_569 [Actinomycetota bacterium]|nr:hypothetical protein [Glaciihabitans sp.]MDQ1529165.1 hypothetical protein [Actinomycetota bacterium]MDQ1542931.1 hypothetical protein [Actinomycetota bacterium]MDQ1563176.1 hypothetical protein [Actinomycetota bacterium]